MLETYLILFGILIGLYHYNRRVYWIHLAAAVLLAVFAAPKILLRATRDDGSVPGNVILFWFAFMFVTLAIAARGAMIARARLNSPINRKDLADAR